MILTAIVEIPKGSSLKFEINKVTGRLRVDRELNQEIPFNYGYVEGPNLCKDGDSLDIFIVGESPIPHLTEVDVEVFGVLKCFDNGVEDDKLLGRIAGSNVNGIFGISLIRNYLSTYKSGFVVGEFEGVEEAKRVYLESLDLYNSNLVRGLN
jgi:inorganic pyrophosphatase